MGTAPKSPVSVLLKA